jgi:Caspase domain
MTPLLQRRRLVAAAAAAAWLPGAGQGQGQGATERTATAASEAAAASAAGEAASAASGPLVDPSRMALVIGNRRYPAGHELPSIHKNARDMVQALQQRGFATTLVLDADTADARRAVDAFIARAQSAPDDATLFFYFSGHGTQIDAENLLLSAGALPDDKNPANLQRDSLSLNRDVVQRLPRRAQGLTVAVVDACRTGPEPLVRGADGLNQVEAPPGCLIAFSTGAGKPAIAPLRETLPTFYTGALVEQLAAAPDDLSFSDLFRLVKIKVQDTMLNHRLKEIRALAQYPFIAENTRVTIPVASARQVAQARQRASSEALARQQRDRAEEDRDWAQLQDTAWAPDLLRAAERFRQRWPGSGRAGATEVLADGARQAAEILRRNDLRLYRRSFEPDAARDAAYNADLKKAARGDKDAAARVGRQWATADLAGAALSRYEGWMQFAAELGNGIASYELALHYRRRDQPQPAARWEARARELGYTPPATLGHYRK